MTNEQIRKCIKINHYHLHHDGVFIQYWWSTNPSEAWEDKELSFKPTQLITELDSMGEINRYGSAIEYNGILYNSWLQFMDKWIFSQWDALNLAIRHEYNKAVEEDVNNSDIGKAINKLLK